MLLCINCSFSKFIISSLMIACTKYLNSRATYFLFTFSHMTFSSVCIIMYTHTYWHMKYTAPFLYLSLYLLSKVVTWSFTNNKKKKNAKPAQSCRLVFFSFLEKKIHYLNEFRVFIHFQFLKFDIIQR